MVRLLDICQFLGCLSEDLLKNTSKLTKVQSFFTKKLSSEGNIWDVYLDKKNNEIIFFKKFRGIEEKFKFNSADFLIMK